MSKKISNITALRDDLLENYEKLKTREIDIKQAREFANLSGKIIKSAALEMDYMKMTGSKKKIKFMEQ